METLEFDDVGDAIREGRALRPANAYRILFALENLDFRPLAVADPIPLGRQILEAAGLEPERGYSLFAIVGNGDFEDVRLDEPFDLRGAGAERFVAFLTDRDFKFEVNSHEERWGKPVISGQVLAVLAKLGLDEAVFREVRGGTDVLVEPEMLIDLAAPGVERFFTAPRPPVEIEIVVNTRARLVRGPTVTFEQIVELAFPGPHEANVVFSMTYRKAASTPHAGELGAHGVVTTKQGTVFNVTRTVQS
ncbi:multiubiquitin domain-containing protein [Sphingomonas sp. A2-49]|uniref:multiubiquitin domain-containing protein n=1 Tax=Sphingomonas sp. A2-49 TaxID=1391375 RepID=UPI0021D37E36|nr:multiubiquitin domain-containing protein [Sphingomonas sp. A2-49]MCU6456029.1 multiubiquitin domain-containing protein [Sphingomonas sp. A2-49]